jgi:hypothetical protein
MTTNTKESGFEALIVKHLVEQNGYEQGVSADYSREYAIDETRLFRFLTPLLHTMYVDKILSDMKAVRTTILSGETDPNQLYDRIADMEQVQVYTTAQVEQFVELYIKITCNVCENRASF